MRRCATCRAEVFLATVRRGGQVQVESNEPEVHYVKLADEAGEQVAIVLETREVLTGRRVTRFEDGACRVEGLEVHRCRRR